MTASPAVAEQLGIRASRSSGLSAMLRHGIRAVASTPPGSRVCARVMPLLDRAVGRLTSGRRTATEWVAGVPTLLLTTTGARSGLARTVPLVGIVAGHQLAVIGSNWGGASHPGWVHNLSADPRAVVSRAGRQAEVRAVEAVGSDAERIWQAARAMYRGYAKYPERTGGRAIRVFVLESRLP